MKPETPSILIVEDDAEFARLLATGLEEENIQVWTASSVGAAEKIIREKTLDIILLDLGLPEREGTEVLRLLKQTGHLIPTIIISARGEVDERIRGLGLGADDYLVKPFAFAELVARLRAVLRRSLSSDRVLSIGVIRLDLTQRRAFCRDEPVDLSPREFELLAYLARNAGYPVSRDMLARDVFRVRSRVTPVNNLIDVNISRLRDKLAKAGPDAIQTVRGIGYLLSDAS